MRLLLNDSSGSNSYVLTVVWRLHDVLTNVQRKYDKQEKLYRDDNQQLTADYKHQLDQFRDVQKKAQSVWWHCWNSVCTEAVLLQTTHSA